MIRSGADATLPNDEPAGRSLLAGLRQRAGTIATIAVFLLALIALQSLLGDFHYHQIIAQLKSLSARQFLIALPCTALSYFTLTGYDYSALRYVGVKLPYRLISFASFTSYAVSNNLGFTVLSGGSIRFRLYSAAGVSAGIDMALWLVGQIRSPDFARTVQRMMEYDPAPPYAAAV